jgi:hypothetical protein
MNSGAQLGRQALAPLVAIARLGHRRQLTTAERRGGEDLREQRLAGARRRRGDEVQRRRAVDEPAHEWQQQQGDRVGALDRTAVGSAERELGDELADELARSSDIGGGRRARDRLDPQARGGREEAARGSVVAGFVVDRAVPGEHGHLNDALEHRDRRLGGGEQVFGDVLGRHTRHRAGLRPTLPVGRSREQVAHPCAIERRRHEGRAFDALEAHG